MCIRDRCERVGRCRVAAVLDEVRVLERDSRSADSFTLEPAGVDHAPGAELALGILEHAAEGADARRLARSPLLLLGLDAAFYFPRGAPLEPELGADDDLPGAERGASVAQAELSFFE